MLLSTNATSDQEQYNFFDLRSEINYRVSKLGVIAADAERTRFTGMDQTRNITQMLRQWSDGNRDALEDVMPLVYDELQKQAAQFLSHERRDHTLQATALIHETYLKLINQDELDWESRSHFFAISAKLMRRILVDQTRTNKCQKRGGEAVRISLAEVRTVYVEQKGVDLMALDEALHRLEERDSVNRHASSNGGISRY